MKRRCCRPWLGRAGKPKIQSKAIYEDHGHRIALSYDDARRKKTVRRSGSQAVRQSGSQAEGSQAEGGRLSKELHFLSGTNFGWVTSRKGARFNAVVVLMT